jgi:hypothetical protein
MLLDFITTIVTNIVSILSSAPAYPLAVVTRVHHVLDVLISTVGVDTTMACALIAVVGATLAARERRS